MKAHRRERVASVIRDIVSAAINYELSDPRLTAMTTVTRVDVSGDLMVAKVFISVLGSDADERKTMAAIQHAAGYLQSKVAGQMSMRQCPQLRFLIDEGAKTARETFRLLEENLRRNPSLAAQDQPPETAADEAEPGSRPLKEDQPGGGGA